jgi:ubiquinone/menaquinone biosynthesis C-methylase UbiE
VPPGSRYLDVGCGAGTYTRWLADQKLEAIGLDYSLPTLKKARARTSDSIPLCAGDAMRLPFSDATFDGVLCFGLLQAVAESTRVVTELARVLKPDGEIWIDALNRGGLAAHVERMRLRLRGKGMHLRYETSAELATVLRAAGFRDLRRHWLPILPMRLGKLQPVLESRIARSVLAAIYPAGVLSSHAFVLHARRGSGIR